MMACNDLTLADQALAHWKKEQRRSKSSRQSGACMYFVRLQISHLKEGLTVIAQLREDPDLRGIVANCDPHTQSCFQELEQYVQAGPKKDRFEKLAGRIRHSLAFHYDKSHKLIVKAIVDRAVRPEARVSLITRGDNVDLWHFRAADDVVESIVVRQIWDIPRSADLRHEADAISDELHKVLCQFLDFSGEFIWKYL